MDRVDQLDAAPALASVTTRPASTERLDELLEHTLMRACIRDDSEVACSAKRKAPGHDSRPPVGIDWLINVPPLSSARVPRQRSHNRSPG